MGLKEMKISSRLKGGIYEVRSGYHSKMDGYATLMPDIPKLCDIVGRKRYYYKVPASCIPTYEICHKEKGINVCYR